MELLAQRERSLGELVVELQLPHRAVSMHVQRLCDGAVVAARNDGRHHRYMLRSDPLGELAAWLSGLASR
jgi:DNA-binding transcriptional ArsR family regulator